MRTLALAAALCAAAGPAAAQTQPTLEQAQKQLQELAERRKARMQAFSDAAAVAERLSNQIWTSGRPITSEDERDGGKLNHQRLAPVVDKLAPGVQRKLVLGLKGQHVYVDDEEGGQEYDQYWFWVERQDVVEAKPLPTRAATTITTRYYAAQLGDGKVTGVEDASSSIMRYLPGEPAMASDFAKLWPSILQTCGAKDVAGLAAKAGLTPTQEPKPLHCSWQQGRETIEIIVSFKPIAGAKPFRLASIEASWIKKTAEGDKSGGRTRTQTRVLDVGTTGAFLSGYGSDADESYTVKKPQPEHQAELTGILKRFAGSGPQS